MAATEIPAQYTLLFHLLREYSAAYSDQLAKAWTDNRDEWNPRTARFEVDTYFVFHLSRAILGHKQERQVWEDMCFLCEAALVNIHEKQLLNDNLSSIIGARMKEYGDIANSCAQSGEADIGRFTDRLRQRIMASTHDDHVEENPPFVICDIFTELDRRYWHLRTDLIFAGAFCCALKHIFQRTNDVRNLSEAEFSSLVEAGQEEARPIAKKMIKSLTMAQAELHGKIESLSPDRSVKAKHWWQFWR